MSSVDPPKNASGDRSDDLSCEDGFFAEGWVYCIPNRYNDQYADMKGIWDKGWMNKWSVPTIFHTAVVLISNL